ncbi:unnamed protein product, partial [Medioppia subpectinata]
MGLEFGRMFCNSVNVIDEYMSSIPEHWAMAEAVTVLSTYSTVHYGLIKRAHLRKGENVLIHSGAGGVGQAAINVCKHYECDIYATVETDRKKQFLINKHNIPENRIFISTDVHFNDEIMDATDGQGVDVVFNSLMGEKLSTGLMNCLRLEAGGENLRYIFHMDTNTGTNFDFNTKPYSDILVNDLVANVIKGGKVGTYRHLKLPNGYDKCLSNDYYLNLESNRDLVGLQWFDSQCHIPMGPEKIYPDCLLGFEYVGRRADTGERVMGLEFGRMFCNSVNVIDEYMSSIPEHWSMAEAVTVLSTYSTVHYGLIKRANLRKGESVLIHSGAGGVGQAAINVCKHYECDIYATVETERKKQFLINTHNIPENRIFISTDVHFNDEIMDATDGQGVDVVFNSLMGEKLSTSFECLAISGRFVQIGRYDTIDEKQLPINDSIRDIQFTTIFMDFVIMNDSHYLDEFYDWMHKNSTNNCIKPLNYTVFEAKDADKAFRYMTSGEHIGKIVVKMRDEESERTAITFIRPVPELLVSVKTYFNPNKVYIITGGLGGFGLELISWMQSLGARKFVITSRSGLKTDYQKFIVNRFMKKYKKYFMSNLIVSTANGLTIEGTKQLLNEAKELAPIGGVFHLALELNDSLFKNITFEKFCSTVDTKHKIFANLDQMSRLLDYKLDYFVVFSSISCGKGNAGQSNYGFGNSLCERICEERRRDGLHGLAVQYGPVGDVGVFESSSNETPFASTLGKQRILLCCDVLDKLLAIKQPIVTSYITQDNSNETKQTDGKQKRIIVELWRTLGIDPNSTPNDTTLGDIGIDSMFATELRHELNRDYHVQLTLTQL